MTNVEKIVKEYEQELEWASSVVSVGENLINCLVCGEAISESLDRHGLILRCPNGHELILRDYHRNN